MASCSRSPFCKKKASILYALYHLNNEERAALLKKARPALVKVICECALNILSGNIPLTKSQKSNLRKHVHILRKLVVAEPGHRNGVDRKHFGRKKKKLIVQKGSGFIPALLAPLLGTLLSSLLSK